MVGHHRGVTFGWMHQADRWDEVLFAVRSFGLYVDLVTLAAMLGHSRIEMVLRYAHPTEEHQFAAMERVQRYNSR